MIALVDYGMGNLRSVEKALTRVGGDVRIVTDAADVAKADALVLPSLHECGGAVILEAMCVGLPVVATNWGGPADYVDASCGILVEPASQEGFVLGLKEALVTLAKDAGLRERLGRAGREKVLRDFDWERKGERMMEIYAEAAGVKSETGTLAERGETPRLGWVAR